MKPLRPCLDCGRLTTASRCPTCQHVREQARGNAAARGYGRAHQAERAAWAPAVASGTVLCARCHLRIVPGTPWDLGHTDDRRGWTGPEHARCNRAAPRLDRGFLRDARSLQTVAQPFAHSRVSPALEAEA